MSPLYPHDILLLLNDCLLYMIVVTNTISTLYHMVIYEQSSSNNNLSYIYILVNDGCSLYPHHILVGSLLLLYMTDY